MFPRRFHLELLLNEISFFINFYKKLLLPRRAALLWPLKKKNFSRGVKGISKTLDFKMEKFFFSAAKSFWRNFMRLEVIVTRNEALAKSLRFLFIFFFDVEHKILLLHFEDVLWLSVTLWISELADWRLIYWRLELVLRLSYSFFLEFCELSFLGQENVAFDEHQNDETEKEGRNDDSNYGECCDIHRRTFCVCDSNVRFGVCL